MTRYRRRRLVCLASLLVLSAAVAIASLPSIPPAFSQTSNPDSSQGSLPEAASFSFGVAGDLGADSATTATLDALAGADTSFFLAIGDLSYNQIKPESAWCSYVKQHVGATYPFELLVGNHEETATSQGGFIDNFVACLPDRLGVTGLYAHQYYFDYPPDAPLARFILIDPDLTRGEDPAQYCTKGDTANCDWLTARIDDAKSQGLWTIVGMHKNCITIGEKSCEIGAPLFNVLLEHKVDVILQGHDHGYQRSKQLSLGPDCPELEPDVYNGGCIARDGGDDAVFRRGAGPVFVVSAAWSSVVSSDMPLPGLRDLAASSYRFQMAAVLVAGAGYLSIGDWVTRNGLRVVYWLALAMAIAGAVQWSVPFALACASFCAAARPSNWRSAASR